MSSHIYNSKIDILPYQAKRVYLSERLKIFNLRKTKNVFRCVFKALFTMYCI